MDIMIGLLMTKAKEIIDNITALESETSIDEFLYTGLRDGIDHLIDNRRTKVARKDVGNHLVSIGYKKLRDHISSSDVYVRVGTYAGSFEIVVISKTGVVTINKVVERNNLQDDPDIIPSVRNAITRGILTSMR